MDKMKGTKFSLWNKLDLDDESREHNKRMRKEIEKMMKHANKHGCKFKMHRDDD